MDESKDFLQIAKDRHLNFEIVGGNIIFNGYAYFRGCTSLTVIPEGTVFNGDVDFKGCTRLTAIPEGTVFNDSAYFQGCTSLTSFPMDFNCTEVFAEHTISGHNLRIIDGLDAVVVSEKQANGVTLQKCRRARFEKGRLVGELFFVASGRGENAHGRTAKEAIEELAFKTGTRDASQYKSLKGDDVKSPEEWAIVYRTITGACRFGCNDFMQSKGKLKSGYTLAEVIEETKGAWGHQTFTNFFGG